MKTEVYPIEKYDPTYEKDAHLWILGILITVFIGVLKYINSLPDSWVIPMQLGFGILAAYLCYYAMQRQNRESFWTAFAALCFPLPVLIIAGVLKKRNIRFEVNTNVPQEDQIEELRKYASKFVANDKFYEAAFIYKYITKSFPRSESDMDTYNELVEKAGREITDFYVKKDKIPGTEIKPIIQQREASENQVKISPKKDKTIKVKKRKHVNINRVALAFIMTTLFIHILFIINKTYDGLPKEQHGKYINADTRIAYFDTFPIWSVNIFYTIYFFYVLLIVFGKLKIDTSIFKNKIGVAVIILFLPFTGYSQIETYKQYESLVKNDTNTIKKIIKFDGYSFNNNGEFYKNLNCDIWTKGEKVTNGALCFCRYVDKYPMYMYIDSSFYFLQNTLLYLDKMGYTHSNEKDQQYFEKGNKCLIIANMNGYFCYIIMNDYKETMGMMLLLNTDK